MKTYKYKGKQRTAAANILLYPDCEYDLPPADKHVQSLVAKGLLEEVKENIDNKKTEKNK